MASLRGVDSVIVDLDGVVWLGGDPIRPNVEALAGYMECGLAVVVLTNNSTRSRRLYSLMLERIGLRIPPESIVTSGYSASEWMARRWGSRRVFVVGEEGLVEELTGRGHVVVTITEPDSADTLVVGLDRGLTYAKLEAALRVLSRGGLFVATNRDHVVPTRRGLSPGAGAIVAALERASGRRVDFDAGKPNPWIMRLALEAAGSEDPSRVVVVGDRLDTDVELALRVGARPVLVLTGVAREEDLKGAPKGLVVVRNLRDLELC